MLYRVKQFIKAVTATVTGEEENWVKGYLSLAEAQLFFRLKVYEQRHCIDVAKILGERTLQDREMIRLGLLHDIGKIKYPLNPIEKSLIVLLDKLTQGRIKKYDQLKMVKCYYKHPQLGCELLKSIGAYNHFFLEGIKGHHQKEIKEEKIRLLQEVDNLC
ncbi:MAG: HD domain-containing protein [Cellulosilyticum sp.]|nr:HD domain-containing protein [Cellulosilyticum sp.]